jgi:hypothetical protein
MRLPVFRPVGQGFRRRRLQSALVLVEIFRLAHSEECGYQIIDARYSSPNLRRVGDKGEVGKGSQFFLFWQRTFEINTFSGQDRKFTTTEA